MRKGQWDHRVRKGVEFVERNLRLAPGRKLYDLLVSLRGEDAVYERRNRFNEEGRRKGVAACWVRGCACNPRRGNQWIDNRRDTFLLH